MIVLLLLAPVVQGASFALTYQSSNTQNWSPASTGSGAVVVTTSSVPPVMEASVSGSGSSSAATKSIFEQFRYTTNQPPFLSSGVYEVSVVYSFALGARDLASSATCGSMASFTTATADTFINVEIFNSVTNAMITQGTLELGAPWSVGPGSSNLISGQLPSNSSCSTLSKYSTNDSGTSVSGGNSTGTFPTSSVPTGTSIYVLVNWVFYVGASTAGGNSATAWVNGTTSDTFSVTSVKWW